MKRWTLIALFLLLPLSSQAETINAGFVQGLWFSSQPIFAGDTVRVYVAIRNNTEAELKGRVSFYDNDTRFSRMNVSALDGRIVEGWADWTATYGEHSISADLTQIEIDYIDEGAQTASVTAALAEAVIFIDNDTDGDDVGDMVDTDDDGDGVSDKDEKLVGTDPLVYDEPESEEAEESTEDNTGDDEKSVSVSLDDSDGLEQYLTPSRARSALSTVTNKISNTKEKLDEYRSSREQRKTEPFSEKIEGTEPNDETDDGLVVISDEPNEEEAVTVGEITRHTERKDSLIKNIWSTAASVAVAAFDFTYTWMLFGLSWLLGYPIMVQLLLLILILFIPLKLAYRWSKRPE